MKAKKTEKVAASRGGRPSKFDDRYIGEAYGLALLGATDKEIAQFWQVSEATLNTWKQQHPEFLESLTRGKVQADTEVSRRLFQRAIGYSNERAVKIFMPAGAKEPVYAPYTEHYPPDVTAAIFWLKNRQRTKWRDRIDKEVTGKDGAPLVDAAGVVEGVVRALTDRALTDRALPKKE
ncbi:MAG: helix-turn-helix domain-containing protein [Pseudomonadota bacterium]